MIRVQIGVAVGCLCIGTAAATAADQGEGAGNVLLLDQGWTDDERLQFYFTTQGSQLMPYDWFLALEQAEGEELFRSDRHMEQLRFIPHPGDPQRNPDRLPIGFVKDDNPKTMDRIIKRSFFGKHDDPEHYPLTNAWVGLTCAACHTTELESGGQRVRIDGGPALADVESFLRSLSASVDATLAQPEKMERFAKRVLDPTGANDTEAEALRQRMATYAKVLQATVRRGEGTTPYGMGRLDAFGAILNEVCETALELPENHHAADAPASFPFLWNTSQLDWVQWNGSTGNPIARNVGEVLGVFGHFRLLPNPPEDRFRSTVHVVNLFELEQHVAKLQAPQWPAQFGKIDAKKAEQGRDLFMKNCQSCHGLPDPESGQFPMVQIADKSYIQTKMVPLNQIGTDPKLALNFATRTAKPGALAALLPPPLRDAPQVPRFVLLSAAVKGVIGRYVQEEGLDADHVKTINGYRPNDEQPPNLLAYKARPLNGIWATAPFLHNGSVPNLYELLLPANQRSKRFFVGSRVFDTRRVGFATEPSAGSFEFRVDDQDGVIAGNSNAGHEGHGCNSREGYTETFEDGKWREFTDQERWALVEYMKWIGNPAAWSNGDDTPAAEVERVPPEEASQIEEIVAFTLQQLRNRYPDQRQVLRAVHAKDHGCVKAVFQVADDLDHAYRVGVFAEPGRRYEAWVRFSNAATLVLPDHAANRAGKPTAGSRGMAIKLMGIAGQPLLTPHGALTQDFLLVNHPVFPFANVEDYRLLSEVLADPDNREQPDRFFETRFRQGGEAAARANKTREIAGRIQAATVAEGTFQPQPASPVDCRYFSGAPFRFGEQAVMKYSVTPIDPATGAVPNIADPNYLRNALIARLAPGKDAKPVVFKFQVQRRTFDQIDISQDIENVQTQWSEADTPPVTVATLTIPPQDFDSPSARQACEDLVFTPWHGVEEFRPLGGINRLRRAVYEASAAARHLPKEPGKALTLASLRAWRSRVGWGPVRRRPR